jgi:two-component system chemotaxis response regulator CheY
MAKNIMIVDDSISMRQVLGIALRGAGYLVIEGCDGIDALKKLTGQKVHLIISDVNMPNMDGISFLKAVKALPAYKFTPVIMLTTVSDEAKVAEGRAAGARAWVSKPFLPEKLIDAAQRLCLP